MKKIINLLKGSPIAMVVIGILIAGVASAALVDYLSNTVQVDIEVKSPMVVGISGGTDGTSSWAGAHFPNKDWDYDWSKTPLTILNSEGNPVKGGETATLYTLSKNIANVEIKGYEEAIVTNPLGVTCKDFKSVKVYVDSIYGDQGYGSENDVLQICVQGDDNNTVKFDSEKIGEAALSTWGAGEADVSKIVVTFEDNAFGTYTVKTTVIPQ